MNQRFLITLLFIILFLSACRRDTRPDAAPEGASETIPPAPVALDLADFPPGSTPVLVEKGDFWLVHLADGRLLAFAPLAPEYDEAATVDECRYIWTETLGRFVDPCSGDEWELDGRLNLQYSTERWSNRALDQYAVSVEDGDIHVFVDRLLRGKPVDPQGSTTANLPPPTPLPTATNKPPPTATAVPSSTPLPTATAEPPTPTAEPPTATYPPPPTAPPTNPPPPTAVPQSVPTVTGISEPLLIDGERGRIYASAQVNRTAQSVVLDAEDGRLLDAFDPAGKLALDRNHNRLIVDQAQRGLQILDAESGVVLSAIPLPAAEDPPPPQVEPTTGHMVAFRGQTVYMIDPASASVLETITLNIERTSCDVPDGEAAIWRSDYDLTNQTLYLSFITRTCTPHVSATIIAYNVTTMAELGRYVIDASYQAVPFGGTLYGTSTASSLVGRSLYWAWKPEGAWYEEGSSAVAQDGIVADWGRQLVYEAINGQIRVLDPATRAVVRQTAVDFLAGYGRLAGHDPHSDNLYFLTEEGWLRTWPAANLMPALRE